MRDGHDRNEEKWEMRNEKPTPTPPFRIYEFCSFKAGKMVRTVLRYAFLMPITLTNLYL
jgi:hypothetical protein